MESCIHRWLCLGFVRQRSSYSDERFLILNINIGLFVVMYDIDIIIEPKEGLNLNLLEVRSQLEELDERFARAGVKLYFVRVSISTRKKR